MKKTNIFVASSTIVSLKYQRMTLHTEKPKSKITRQLFDYYHVFEISGNSKGGQQVRKRKEQDTFFLFYYQF